MVPFAARSSRLVLFLRPLGCQEISFLSRKRRNHGDTTVAQPLAGTVNWSFLPATPTVIVRVAPLL